MPATRCRRRCCRPTTSSSLTKSDPLDERERDEGHEVALQLRAALARLKGLVDDTRRLGKNELPVR